MHRASLLAICLLALGATHLHAQPIDKAEMERIRRTNGLVERHADSLLIRLHGGSKKTLLTGGGIYYGFEYLLQNRPFAVVTEFEDEVGLSSTCFVRLTDGAVFGVPKDPHFSPSGNRLLVYWYGAAMWPAPNGLEVYSFQADSLVREFTITPDWSYISARWISDRKLEIALHRGKTDRMWEEGADDDQSYTMPSYSAFLTLHQNAWILTAPRDSVPTSTGSNGLYCLTPTSRWSYTSSEISSSGSIGRVDTFTSRVHAVWRSGNEDWYEFDDGSYWTNRSDGAWRLDRGRAVRWFAHLLGDSSVLQLPETNPTQYRVIRLIAVDVPIQTPAGTFETFEYHEYHSEQPGTIIAKHFIAPGIGLVHSSSITDSDRRISRIVELIRFDSE